METIISLATRQIYEIEVRRNSENQMPCPECSASRRKKNTKCFSYNAEKEVGYCNHCEARFVKHVPFEQKQYVKPNIEWQNYTKLSDKVVKWFEGRGISQKTLIAAKIGEKKEFMPQTVKDENCIMFPYFRNGELVNTKFRDARKNFKLVSGAELIWWNYDALKKHDEVVICEGEIDGLAFMQAGFDNVVSVPNGANIGKMEYFDSSFEDLNKVKSFIIATDNDLKGLDLKNDLIRRLGIEKCKTVNFKHFKDANEVLASEGVEGLQNLIKSAKNIKLSDVYAVEDFQNEIDSYFENGIPQGLRIEVEDLDEKIRWQTGRFGVVTGSPSCFKHDQLVHTSQGVTEISKLNIGDRVLSYNHDKKLNEYRKVISKSSNSNKQGKMYRIKMKDGLEINVTEDHRFFTGTEYLQIKDILLSLPNKFKKQKYGGLEKDT